MKKIFLILLMLTTSIFAQKKVNNYKYIIVPNKFDFVNTVDQYQTSSLTKFLFNRAGFTVFLSDDKLPKDLSVNRCLALTGTIKDASTMFVTKSKVELKDCSNNVIYTSIIGKSKTKDYKKAYHEAIRNAFKSIETLNYKYVPVKKEESNNLVNKTPIVTVPKIIKNKEVLNRQNNTIVNLYAQTIANGFQLVNTKPSVVYQILKTNVADVFILKNKNGILYKNNANWIAEYYKDGVKVTEQYQIKF
ncbi:hypothetical protein Q4553_09845 [Tenacibaculum soleae]|uniref:hypothetical protein n=1 Tax=Tenacibaculum soleae TaxID=447689 RepID=UPI0026E24BFC|nr:hypothetical protein [Tenacibaculum soleae]MDO6744879.1 hypothetical protein [Tenacibaculum soleae]